MARARSGSPINRIGGRGWNTHPDAHLGTHRHQIQEIGKRPDEETVALMFAVEAYPLMIQQASDHADPDPR